MEIFNMWISNKDLPGLLVGKKVKEVYMNQEYLKFVTDKGNVVFTVYGDCCSSSYFHDFYGVKKLLENGEVVNFKEVELKEGDYNWVPENHDGAECIQCYGYAITTVSPEFGEVTSIFSFRNSSNGYYGGSLELADENTDVQQRILDDILEVK